MKKIALVVLMSALFTGCASVKMEDAETTARAKQFAPPAPGNASLYVYRDSFVGKALKKDILVDGKCLGESASDVFFRTEVSGDKEHEISTESEFSPNTIKLMFDAGKNYFVRQYIKMGAFVGGADLELVTESQGKEAIAKLGMAAPGTCGN